MVTPFVVPAGKAAVAAATKGAAAGAARIAITEKAAKAFAGATKSIESSFESGALQSAENVFGNIRSSHPVMVPLEVVTARLTMATTQRSLELMGTVLDKINDPAFDTLLTNLAGFINDDLSELNKLVQLLGGSKIIDFINVMIALIRVATSGEVALGVVVELWERLVSAIERISVARPQGAIDQQHNPYGDLTEEEIAALYTNGGLDD